MWADAQYWRPSSIRKVTAVLLCTSPGNRMVGFCLSATGVQRRANIRITSAYRTISAEVGVMEREEMCREVKESTAKK